jgi:hypothetical protein
LSRRQSHDAKEPLIVAELLRPHGIRGEMMARVTGVGAEECATWS